MKKIKLSLILSLPLPSLVSQTTPFNLFLSEIEGCGLQDDPLPPYLSVHVLTDFLKRFTDQAYTRHLTQGRNVELKPSTSKLEQ